MKSRKCSNCGATLTITRRGLECTYCGSVFESNSSGKTQAAYQSYLWKDYAESERLYAECLVYDPADLISRCGLVASRIRLHNGAMLRYVSENIDSLIEIRRELSDSEIQSMSEMYGVDLDCLDFESILKCIDFGNFADLRLYSHYMNRVTNCLDLPNIVIDGKLVHYRDSFMDSEDILPCAFCNLKIESLTITPQIHNVRTLAFSGSKIRRLVVESESVSFDNDAFMESCPFEEIDFKSHIKRIGNLSMLRAETVHFRQLEEIETNCFQNSMIGNLTIDEGLILVEPFAFRNIQAGTIRLPKSLHNGTVGSNIFGDFGSADSVVLYLAPGRSWEEDWNGPRYRKQEYSCYSDSSLGRMRITFNRAARKFSKFYFDVGESEE